MKGAPLAGLRFLIFVLVLGGLLLLSRFFKITPAELQGYLDGLTLVNAAMLFIVLYVLVTFFIWLSKDAFRIVAAVIFGAGLSTLLIWIAETLNAAVLFHFSRLMGKSFIEQSVLKSKNKLWQDRLSRHSGFFSLVFLRVVPLVPFRFLDLVMGLSPLPFRRYLAVVIIGSPLRIYWLQYILAVVIRNMLRSPPEIMQYLLAEKTIFIVTLVYFVLAVILSFRLGAKE